MYSNTIDVLPQSPLRWLYAMPLAALLTFGLLVFMLKLIFVETAPIDEPEEIPIPDVTWEEPPPIEPRFERPEKIEEPKPTPEVPENPVVDDVDLTASIPTSKYTKPDFYGRPGFDPSMPIERFMVTPKYPGRALAKGIEGFVELRFDVNKMGSTENVQVTHAEPQGYFEKSALEAAKRWKFQPKTENGKPVYYRNLSKRVTFEMQNS